MKYLIVFMSHHGTTRSIAVQMAENLGKEHTVLVDLKNDPIPDLNSFETIIIGGSIHTGKIQKQISEFCKDYKRELLTKRVGLFICAMETEEIQGEFNNAFPEWLRKHAIAHGYFGGELLLDKMNFFEKTIVKSIYGIKENLHQLDHDAIEAFEKTISGESKDQRG